MSQSQWVGVNNDKATNAAFMVEYDHHEVHSGSHFIVTDVQNVDTTTLKWMITTPNTTKWAHLIGVVGCTGEVYVVVTEGADRTGTNLLTAINRNRNSAKTATTAVHRAYSGGSTDGATTIFSERSGATGQGNRTLNAGQARGQSEFVLKQNTKYIVSVTTYADVYVTLELDWYEHTDKA